MGSPVPAVKKAVSQVVTPLQDLGSSLENATRKAADQAKGLVQDALPSKNVAEKALAIAAPITMPFTEGGRDVGQNAINMVAPKGHTPAPTTPTAPTPAMPSIDSEAILQARRRRIAASMLSSGRGGSVLTGQSEVLGG